ncbi:histidinol-phosphate phosphatase family protein [Thioflavicoccus mobilis 8321]|uniref:D,D-heptose 1,7-bisphosphate phosphatase n=1 Tax=Thioflavicoccus mobilis 8321 TaxID=765912 RepID=L0H2Q1_9GAMM|nr:D-glycero-beta-D-manno-heptose 1,7-bisphosphate 7-phosphatase [Thioflavicoccus mobilis]AGA92342.1 histidinol-phosphate phosphatase family protein [Thioflavicoccus mobilis 8321]
MTKARLVLIDRDGVINEDSPDYIKGAEEWRPIPGSLEAIARLNRNDHRVCVVSNQSGLARGLFTIDDLNAIHQKLRTALDRIGGEIEGIFFCPHAPDAGCDCRKPAPGLLLAAAQRLHVDLQGVPVIGDSLGDILAARAVGAEPLLVLTGKGAQTLREHPDLIAAEAVFPDLAAAIDHLIRRGE